jgi:streptogramin lyase
VGSYPITVSAGTLTAANYSFTFVDGTLSITQAASLVTWAPAKTTDFNGQPLGAGVLSAQGSVPGLFSYTASSQGGPTISITQASGLATGTYTLTATLTPTDSVDFAGSSASVLFTVLPQSVWITDGSGGLSVLNDGGGGSSSQPYPGGIVGAAIDNGGSIWSLTSTGVVKTSEAGVNQLTVAGTGGLNAPTALAIDGAGQVWIANGNNSLSVISDAGAVLSPSSGFTDPSLSGSSGVAIDNSGSVWVANEGNNSVTEIVGAASPVAPLVNGVVNKTLGARP